MTQEQPFYSEAYTKVIALAKRYASGSDDNVPAHARYSSCATALRMVGIEWH